MTLLVVLAVIAAGGCGSSPARRQQIAKSSPPPPSQAGVSWDQILAESDPGSANVEAHLGENQVRSVGYAHGIVAAPIAGLSDDAAEQRDTEVVMLESSEIPATTIGSDEQGVEYFVDLAVAQHPSIQAARQRVAAEQSRITQVRSLPDPMLNNTFWPIHDQALQTAAGRVANQMSLSQSVPWPEKLRTKAAIASQEVQIAQAEVQRIQREVVESVRLAYYEVWFAARAIAIVEETKQLVDDLTKVAEARYRSGGSQQDVLRARLETDRFDEKLIELRRQKEVAQSDLAVLVQQPVTLMPEATEDLGVGDLSSELDELILRAEQCNPELSGLAWEIQRDRQRHRLACLQKYPDLQFGMHWGLVDDNRDVLSGVANGHDMVSFNVGTTLPIWRDKIRAGVREASHLTTSTVLRLDAERDALQGKLRRLFAQAHALAEQRDIYQRRIIPRTEDTLKIAIADYRGRRTDFFSLIETYRELLMFETQLARINASIAGIVAQVERTAGCN